MCNFEDAVSVTRHFAPQCKDIRWDGTTCSLLRTYIRWPSPSPRCSSMSYCENPPLRFISLIKGSPRQLNSQYHINFFSSRSGSGVFASLNSHISLCTQTLQPSAGVASFACFSRTVAFHDHGDYPCSSTMSENGPYENN